MLIFLLKLVVPYLIRIQLICILKNYINSVYKWINQMQAVNVKQQQPKKSSNIPLAVPRAPIPLNPFGSTKKRSANRQTIEKIPDNLEEVKPHREDNDKKSLQILNLDTEQADILHTQQYQEHDEKQGVIRIKTLCDVIEEEGGSSTGGFEDGRKTKAYYARFLLIDQAVSSFSFLSIIIAVLEYDLEYEEREDFIAQSMLWMTFILTLGMILLTVVRFQAKLEWFKTRKVISEKSNLITSGYLKFLILEILMSAVHPMPWTWNIRIEFFNEPQQKNGYYHLNEILLLIMLLRGLLIIRTLLMMSFWYNNRTQRVCSMYACEANYLFIIKCIMKTQPYTLITSAMTISVFFFGFAIRICEAPIMRIMDDGKLYFFSYWNCMWNMIITMTTVGYGDYYAQTHLGRFVIFFVCIWGVFIVSMMVITLNNTLQISTLECKAITVLVRLNLKGQMKQNAAIVLTLLAKIGIENRKGTFVGEFKKIYLSTLKYIQQNKRTQMKLRKALNEFKIAQRQYRSVGDENLGEEMGRQFDFLREDFKEIFKKQNAILETNIQLMQHMRMDQQQIEYYAKNLTRSSFQQTVLQKDEKQMEASCFKVSQQQIVHNPNIVVTSSTPQNNGQKNKEFENIVEKSIEHDEVVNLYDE